MPILSPDISLFFFPSPPLASKAESSETHRGRLSSPEPICILLEIISPIFQPRQYFAAYTRAVSSCKIASPRKRGSCIEKIRRGMLRRQVEREEDRTRGCSSPRERVGVLALSIISYTAAGPASRVLIALQASHYPEFRRLISKSAFYRSKFASSRCLWTKIQAKEVDNKRCTHVLIWTKKQRF